MRARLRAADADEGKACWVAGMVRKFSSILGRIDSGCEATRRAE